MKRLLLGLMMLVPFGAVGQSADNIAYGVGERLTYTITYQATLWPRTAMGKVTLSVNDAVVNGESTYHIVARATTNTFFSTFYKLDDRFETWLAKDTMLPVQFACSKSEGGYKFKSHYEYDWQNMSVEAGWRNLKRTHESTATHTLDAITMDPIAHYYTLRSKDIASWHAGHEYVINIVMDEAVKHVKYRYLGTEQKQIKGLGTVSTLKLACQLANPEEMMDGGDEFYVWVSNDGNKVPILIESPTKIGNVKVSIDSYQGLKHTKGSVLK